MTTEAQGLMQAAAEVARKSGDVALEFFRKGVTVDIKGDGTPVTVADRTSEQTAREWIEARFPQDGILGEEFGETRPGAKRRWILDPIDGTKSFIHHVPLFGTLVALERDGPFLRQARGHGGKPADQKAPLRVQRVVEVEDDGAWLRQHGDAPRARCR